MTLRAAPRDEVHLWLVDLDAPVASDEEARWLALLDEGERERRARFHFEEHRRQYLRSHALVRETLSRYAPVAPEDWRFRTGPFGRPEVADPSFRRLRFNLSHTDGLAACGVVLDADLGVDVEDVTRPGETVEVADRFFAPAEVRALRALPAPLQRDRFFACWTLKESYLKARGAGLHLPLDGFSFELAAGAPPRLSVDPSLADDASSWRFAELRPTARHRAAVAARLGPGAPLRVRVETWPPLGSGGETAPAPCAKMSP